MRQRGRSPLRVMESVPRIRPTTNPYIVQLISALRARTDISVQLFSFRRCIFGRYDVLHVHWPEVMLGGHRRLGRVARPLLTALCLLRTRLTRTAIVRTWHNTERPSGLSRLDHLLLDEFDRQTALVLRLNDTTEVPLDVPVATAPLGHYRDWYAGLPRLQSVPGRVAYVGLIRPQKGVDDLVAAFRGVRAPEATLSVTGRPSTAELEGKIRGLAVDDPRIALKFGFVDEPEFVLTVTQAQLIVLPFRHMHNSSTVLAALSLERPVLVPDNAVNRALADEVGEGWIHTYSGAITAEALDSALQRVGDDARAARPQLDRRGWAEAATIHAEAFRRAAARADPARAPQPTSRRPRT